MRISAAMLFLPLALLAGGCASLGGENAKPSGSDKENKALPKYCVEAECTDSNAQAAIKQAKTQVGTKLGNPIKQTFSKVMINTGQDGIAMVCGEVKAESEGKPETIDRFISRANGNATVLEREVVIDFYKTWERFCVK